MAMIIFDRAGPDLAWRATASTGNVGPGGARRVLDWQGMTRDLFMGRKPKPPGEKKTNVLRIMLTEADRITLDKAARKAGLDTSTWARLRLLGLTK